MTKVRSLRNRLIIGLMSVVCVVATFTQVNTARAKYLDRLMLLDLLRTNELKELEQIFARQERLYQQGKIPEQHLETAYLSFKNSDPELESLLTAWVEQGNSTGFAHVARGLYYHHLGWMHRGTRYANETQKERLQGMRKYFALAKKDLRETLRVRPNAGIAYAYMIAISMALGERGEITQLVKTGLQHSPKSFAIRWKYLASLRPWWCSLTNNDSLKQMEAFISQTVQTQSSEFAPLRGYPDFIRAEILARNNQRQAAVPFYEKALAHGPYYWYYYEQGTNFYWLEQYEMAHTAFSRSLHLRPQVAKLHKHRAKTLAKLGKNKEAIEEFHIALQLDSHNSNILRHLSYVLTEEGHYQAAITSLEKALTYGSHNEYVLSKLGRIYLYELHQPAEGVEYLRQVTELNPNEQQYWYNYGLALYQLYDCQAVDAFHEYQTRCEAGQTCSERHLKWTKTVTPKLVWQSGCWRQTSMKGLFKETIGHFIPF